MKRALFAAAAAAALALGGCAGGVQIPASPGTVAQGTLLDERLALGAELAYKAARKVIETGTDAGLIKGADATKAAALDAKAYSLVGKVRAAYAAGNAKSYQDAYDAATAAIGDLLAAAK